MRSRAAASSPLPEASHRIALPAAVLVASALLAAVAGITAWSIALALLLPLLASRRGDWSRAYAAAAVAAALSVASGGGAAGLTAAMISALLALLAEPSRVRRLAFVAPMAVLVSSGSFRDALPLAIAAGAAGIPARKDLRLALLAAGACACLLAGGLPGAYGTDASPWVARSVARGEGACWPDTVTLDHSAPVLLLDLSPVEGMEVELHASGGGVRDGDPVGRLELPGGTRWDIPPRDTSFTFVAPRGTARVVLSRAWRPFEHPVVRFCSARTTGGGR